MSGYKTIILLAGIVITTTQLSGCAEAVVGGAVAGAGVAHDRRSPGTVLDDQIIEFSAIDRILSDKEIYEKTHVNVTSYNKELLLTGEAPTAELRDKIYDRLTGLPNVRRIHNEIAVAAPSSLLTRSSDTWITAKTKTALFQIKNLEGFDPTRVKVVTENGTVYLLGLVSRNEADAVTNTARKVTGVQRVVKIFQYTN